MNICTLNKIAACGTARFDGKYTITEDLAGATGVMVRSAAMHDMELPESLLAIARAGAGVNNIPVDKCTDAGIVVFNTPGANANAVKELVIAALLISSRKVIAGAAWAQSLKGEGDAVAKLVEKGKSAFAGPEIKGKKICLLTKNSYEYAVNTFGVVAAGAVLVLLNQRKSWDELSYELGLVEPDAILTDGDDYGFNDQLKAAYGDILRPMDGFRSYEPAQLTRCIDHEALMVLMFTSGTTGRSKGVMLSEKNFFSVMRAHTQIGEHMMAYKHEPDLVMSQYTVLPMFHLGAFICLFSWAHAGWALNVSSDIRNFYKEVKRMPSQAMAVVPVIMNSLHHDVMRGRKERLGELWVPICSSAMFDPQVMLDMAEHGMFVVQTYGSTETCGDGIINYAQDAKHIGAVGQGNDYLDYKIAEDGELCMHGDSIMLGYYKDPEATAEVIDADGWFHTGDLARKDEDGYYFLTGRKKNLIILDSGENISPEELEGIVGKCEAVKECVVKEMGKKIGVVVYCDEDKQQQVRDFITEANRTLPLYKRMSAVEFSTEPLPRNGAGKLLRQ